MIINSNEKILLTGSNGMVGNAIQKILKKQINDESISKNNLFCPKRNELDLLDFEAVKSWFSLNKPNTIIIAAAKVGGILANSTKPYDFIFENLRIETNLIEASRLFGVKRILFLGSSCIYPKSSKQPIKEEYLLQSALEETNQWYALAKISGIKLCESLNLQYGVETISLMPCNLYGIGDNYNPKTSHVIPALINKFYTAKENNNKKVVCWGTGNPLREFLFVDDLAKACIFILNNWETNLSYSPLDKACKKNYWINVGSGVEISIKDLAEKIAKITGYTGDIVWDKTMPDGTPRKVLDISKIRTLGWEPETNLDDGLEIAIKDFEDNFYKK